MAVSPEPTPYRAPLWDRIAARDDVALLVVYAARTIAGASWSVTPGHPAVVLRGRRFPGAARVLRHDYPITPGARKVLRRARPDCVVVSGWSTFAAQTALLWCARHGIPYVLLVESHDHDPRAAWRRAVKGAVVPRIVRGAASVLVTGSLAADSMRRRGAPAGRIRVFANTVDVGALHEQAVRLRGRRTELRGLLDLREEDVAVACVGRLVPEKAMDVLLRACAEVGGPLVPVLVDGAEVIPDSTRIMRHLEERWPDPPLFPREPARRAELDVFLEWFNEVWKGPPNTIEAELEKAQPNHDRVAALGARMRASLDLFEQLLDGRDHLLGDEFSAADCAAFPFLKFAKLPPEPADDELFHRILEDHQRLDGSHPRLSAWIDRVEERPRV